MNHSALYDQYVKLVGFLLYVGIFLCLLIADNGIAIYHAAAAKYELMSRATAILSQTRPSIASMKDYLEKVRQQRSQQLSTVLPGSELEALTNLRNDVRASLNEQIVEDVLRTVSSENGSLQIAINFRTQRENIPDVVSAISNGRNHRTFENIRISPASMSDKSGAPPSAVIFSAIIRVQYLQMK